MTRGSDPMAAQFGAAMASFVREFFPGGDGDFESIHGLHNNALGLLKEFWMIVLHLRRILWTRSKQRSYFDAWRRRGHSQNLPTQFTPFTYINYLNRIYLYLC